VTPSRNTQQFGAKSRAGLKDERRGTLNPGALTNETHNKFGHSRIGAIPKTDEVAWASNE
jgi:hypothetical protein